MRECRSGQTGQTQDLLALCLRGFESSFPHARVTQPGLECFPPKEEVAGSNPVVSVLINS